MSKAKFYAVEELHRGEWSPLLVKDADGKRIPKQVGISEEHAEQMNRNTASTKIRYVVAKATATLDLDKATKAELIAHAEGLSIEVSEEDTKADIKAKINA